MRATVLAAALCFSAVGFSQTHPALAAVRKSTAIAEQDLGEALRALERDRNLQLIYLSEDVNERRTQGASGDLTFEEALGQLLQGTGLTYRVLDEKTISIIPVPVAAPATHEPAPAGQTSTPHAIETSPGFWSRLRLASLAAQSDSTSDTAGAMSNTAKADQMETVQVTGSRLSRPGGESAQPTLRFDREQVERSGQSSVTEFLRTLPEVSGASIAEAPNGSYPHVATVQLRGLPAGRTLMLVNGRRLPSSGNVDGGFANLNTIPEAAIERIDVLPQGASAVYGSDALAGVVNVVLRKDLDGGVLNAKYGMSDGLNDRTVSAGWGTTFERGSVMLMGDYYDRTSLYKDERDITRDADYTSRGYRDLRSITCNPGTIYSTGTANLPGLSAPVAAVPMGLTGSPTVADFAGTAGQINHCGWANYNNGLVYPAHRYTMMGMGDFQLTDDVTLFSELWYSRLHHEFYPVTYLSKVTVPASNPFNPFGVPVRVDYQFDNAWLGNPNSDVDERMRRVVLGGRGKLFSDWQWEVTGSAAEDHSSTLFVLPNSSFAPPELASTDPASALNLFTSGMPASEATLMSYVNGGLYTFIPRDAKITSTTANAVLRGSAFNLPAGPVSVAVGAEYGREKFDNTGQRGAFDIDRNDKAAFAEMRIPVFARANAASEAGRELLTLSAAVRRDDYSDFGNATNPQYGLEYRPFESLLVRASYAEAFRAPDLYAVYGPPAVGNTLTATDPRRNNEFVTGIAYVAGGNANLRPESGRSISTGLVWSSLKYTGLRASLGWWRVTMTDRISLFPSTQLIVNNETLFTDRVTRAAPGNDGLPGRITDINYSALNLGDIWVEGVDFDVSHRIDTAIGQFSSSVRATRYTRYDALLNPTLGISDYLANANTDIWVPKWRGTVGLGWHKAAWSVSMDGRYLGKYRDYNPLLNGQYLYLGDTWTFDMNARWDVGEQLHLGSGWLSKLNVSLGAVNVFDRKAQFSASSTPGYGFDAGQYDIRGRYGYLQVGLQF